MTGAYYNDSDPFVAQWLRNLIAEGLLPDGDVDERSIEDVKAEDVRDYTQVHLFAGIGGWPLGLRIAGWEDSRPAWTGSAPCQPFSNAGKRQGSEDRRHVWPAFFGLVSQCRPSVVFGEQVASKLGREWIAGIRLDLEASGYAVGIANLPAAGVHAPHKRERLWWVAHSERRSAERSGYTLAGTPRKVAAEAWPERIRLDTRNGGAVSAWSDYREITLPGGLKHRIEPGLSPMVDGVPEKLGLLRAYGNALVPDLAAVFVRAAMEAIE